MNALENIIYWLADFMWGSWMTVLIFATGLYLSIKFKFSYITKIKFHFKNAIGKMFSKNEGEREPFPALPLPVPGLPIPLVREMLPALPPLL